MLIREMHANQDDSFGACKISGFSNVKTRRKDGTMSVQKKSLINNRVAAKKTVIASKPSEEANPLKASSLTAHSLKAKRGMTRNAFKAAAYKARA